MADVHSALFGPDGTGSISRRRLFQTLALAMAVRPGTASAQGPCGDARGARPDCIPTPAPWPFPPTGWKTVLLDHFSMQVADYRKEAAYLSALLNWTIRSDDGTQAVLDIDDWGGLVIRGGRGRAPGGAVVDSFCWGIEPWDVKTVEAELRRRRLAPVADHDATSDFQSFHIKDADGFALQISNGNMQNRRREPATGRTAAPPPFAATTWKTVWLDHISFETSNYRQQVAFYHALLGWKPGTDDGSENQVQIGDVGDAIIRRGQGPRRAQIDHIAFGIASFDPDAVKAELDARSLTGWVDTGDTGDIHDATYKSYHTRTPNGFDLQVSNVSKLSSGRSQTTR